MKRENAGYEIIASVKVSKHDEIVIGYHPTAPAPYVTWYCTNGDDYFCGAYYDNYADAMKKMIERIKAAGIGPYTTVV